MLQYILSQVAPAVGLNLDNAIERAWLVQQTNKAGKELYEMRDLVNVEREMVFALEGDDQQVSLPYYVHQVRAVRRYDNRDKLKVTDMRPRYKSQGWAEPFLAWREKWKSPLKRAILNEAPVTLSIPEAEEADFTVVITGSTPNSARMSETVTFTAGETEKLTELQFTEIFSFVNLAPHDYDVTMTDADGYELSVLPNVADKAMYIVMQVLDPGAVTIQTPYMVEVLYKNAFLFMREDYDEYVCPEYDDAIAWQTIGNILAKQRPQEAGMAFVKVREVMANIEKDKMQSKEASIDVLPTGKEYPFGLPGGFGRPVGPMGGLFPGYERP